MTHHTPDEVDDEQEGGQRHQSDGFPASRPGEWRLGVVDGAGDAQPRADRCQRRQHDEAADVAEQVAQIRHLRRTGYPLPRQQPANRHTNTIDVLPRGITVLH